MSKRISTKSEETAEAVEELGDALEALPGGGDAGVGEDEASTNPLSRVDASGETSFESAEFESDEEATDDDAFDVVCLWLVSFQVNQLGNLSPQDRHSLCESFCQSAVRREMFIVFLATIVFRAPLGAECFAPKGARV